GRSAKEKLADVSTVLEKAGADAVVLTLPDSVAWAFNIRGGDVSYTPVILAYAILHKSGMAEIFLDSEKLPEHVRAHLRDVAVLRPRDAISDSLRKLGAAKAQVMLDADWSPEGIRKGL